MLVKSNLKMLQRPVQVRSWECMSKGISIGIFHGGQVSTEIVWIRGTRRWIPMCKVITTISSRTRQHDLWVHTVMIQSKNELVWETVL